MIITSLRRQTWNVGTYFGMYRKRRLLALLWYQLHVSGGLHCQVHRGSGNPFAKTCYIQRECNCPELIRVW